LFEPLQLREVTARNRIMISPMCQYCAADAIPRDWHIVHLGSRAVGGAGIVMTGATAVEPRGRITPFDVGLWDEKQESVFSHIASFLSNQGAVPGKFGGIRPEIIPLSQDVRLVHGQKKGSQSRSCLYLL